MTSHAASSWFTAAEIAQLGLAGLPDSTRRVHDWAAADGWAERNAPDGTPLARPRRARGGGTEYHASLFPVAVQLALRSRATATDAPSQVADVAPNVAERWAWFESRSAKVKAEANRRLSILREVDDRVAVGIGKGAAATEIAATQGVSRSTIFEWFKLVAGVSSADRLPFLAAQHKGGQRRAEVGDEAWQLLKSDYMRPEKPAFAACYNRLRDGYATPRGITLPDMTTLKRRLEQELAPSLKKAKREGREASRRSVPPQQRTVADLHALEAVNVDGHTFDVFVQWEDGTIGRPVMVGIQDVYSRKLLAYRIGRTENTLLTRLAFADLFRNYGIPINAVLDNGRAFASKALTGGALTRFRFKIKDTDATGVLTALGVTTHWTLPYRGSSKPIERAWRDQCEDISKHPRVAGAYTGNKPDAKPENYRQRAIPIAEFRAHVADRIAKHNARSGRRTEMAKGRSFDEVFAESYAVAPIGKARPEHLRLALLEAVDVRCDRDSGTITLAGNRYWSVDMVELAGQTVTARLDPDNYHQDIHVYTRDGAYYGVAALIEATGFFDKSGAAKRAKLEKAVKRKVREAEEAADLLHSDQVAAMYALTPATTPAVTAPKVVRTVRHRGQTAAALKPVQQAQIEPVTPSPIDRLVAADKRRLRVVE